MKGQIAIFSNQNGLNMVFNTFVLSLIYLTLRIKGHSFKINLSGTLIIYKLLSNHKLIKHIIKSQHYLYLLRSYLHVIRTRNY